MSKGKFILTNIYAKLAAVLIDAFPCCNLHYEYEESVDRFILRIEGTGFYLREIRPLVPKNFELKYGNTQDTIIIIDTTNI